MDEQQKSQIVKKKRRPGRPPKKNVAKVPVPINGVAATPKDELNVIEVDYALPNLFKKLFIYLANTSCPEIKIRFEENKIYFISQDHFKNSTSLITIDCNKLNHYYCDKPREFYFTFNNINIIIQKIDKSYKNIKLYVTKNNIQKIYIEYETDIGFIEQLDITTANSDLYENILLDKFFLDSWKISLVLDTKYLKKFIGDFKNFKPELVIQKSGTSPLTFEYSSNNKQVRGSHYSEKEQDQIVSRLEENGLFSITVNPLYIKPIANAMFTENIKMYLFHDMPIILETSIENNTFNIRTSIEIVDFTKLYKTK